jgi:DNA polymerase-3 subunit alpha
MPNRNFTRKDSLVEHLEDCKRMGVEVVPPDVNRCGADFEVADGKVFFGLGAIKGCGQSAAEAIVAARRAGGPFRSLLDLCERIDTGSVNRTAVEALIKAGALDSLGARRSQLFQAIDRAMQSGAAAAADRRCGQRSLFAGDGDAEEPAGTALCDLPEWDAREKLAKEKEVLGFYLSSHPLAEHHQTLSQYCSHSTTEAAQLKHRSEVTLGGLLSGITFRHTKNPRPGSPTRYAIFDLEDMEGTIRCILWPEQFAQYGDLVLPDNILLVQGTVEKRAGSDEVNLIASELIPLKDAAGRLARGLRIRLLEDVHGVRGLEQLYEILRGYPGKCRVELSIGLSDGTRVACECDRLRVEINPEVRRRVEELLGPENVRLLASVRPG